MANPILIKRSAVAAKVPLVGDLVLGELALNTTDGKLFMKKSVSGVESIVQVGPLSTSDLAEGTNLYFTNARAQAAVTSVTGNAGTATKLQSARLINGVSFDGTADITINAVATSALAATLTGNTLSSNVTASSLTSVGSLTSLSVNGTATIGGAATFNSSVTVNSTLTATTFSGAINGSVGAISPSTGNFTTVTTSGSLTVGGDLVVNGTTTTINATTLDVADLNITVAKNASTAAAANGAGLTVAGAGATLTYTSSTDSWDFNKSVSATLRTAAQPNITSVGTLTSLAVTGAVTAASFTGSLSGNATTATRLQTARTINGVAFDGSTNITVTADAGTLSGTIDGGSY